MSDEPTFADLAEDDPAAPPADADTPPARTGRVKYSAGFTFSWVISAAPGVPPENLEDAIAQLIMAAGVSVTCPDPASGTFRIVGPYPTVADLAEQIGREYPGVTVALEQPAPGLKVRGGLKPTHEPRRYLDFAGRPDGARMAVAAIVAGLTVRPVGYYQFRATGSTAAHIRWLMAALEKSRADVLRMLGLTEEQAEAEDSVPPSPPIRVELPSRIVQTEIERDRDGNIVDVTQTETTVTAKKG